MKPKSFLARLLADEAGATAVEYGLMVVLVVIAMFAALKGFAETNTMMWNKVRSESATAIAATGA